MKEDFMTVPRDNKFGFDVKEMFKRSSKMQAVYEEVLKVIEKKDKCIIYSQFLGIFDLFEIRID